MEQALRNALQELRDFGVQDPDLESKAPQLEIGQSISGILPDGARLKKTVRQDQAVFLLRNILRDYCAIIEVML